MMKLKEHEKRFGMIAVGKGFITLKQLVKAMEIQVKEDIEKGEHRLIGQILIGMKAMDTAQVMEVLDTADRR